MLQVNGLINDADGGIFDYFWLQNGAICALCGSKTMVSFIVTPLVSAVMTYLFSYLDIRFRGDRARKPIIPVPFDKDDRDTHVEGSSKVDEHSADTDEKEEEGVEVDAEDIDEVDEDGESVYATGFADNTTVFDHTTVPDRDPY